MAVGGCVLLKFTLGMDACAIAIPGADRFRLGRMLAANSSNGVEGLQFIPHVAHAASFRTSSRHFLAGLTSLVASSDWICRDISGALRSG